MTIDLRTIEEAQANPVPSDLILDIPIPPLSPSWIWQMAVALFRVVGHLPRNAPIRLFCARGRRFAVAKEMLTQSGYANVTELGGVG